MARAHDAGVGATLDLFLGGRLDGRFGAPLRVHAEVLRLTDGRFRNEDAMERGMPVDLGRTALLRVARLRVIVTTGCQSPNDAGYFRLHGIDIDEVPVLLAIRRRTISALPSAAGSTSSGPAKRWAQPWLTSQDCPSESVPRERFNLKNQRDS
ncbi:MAG: MlrC C-terminal domain-containing protein [Alphaproteobacteria bacterium]|nr:MlrC C-terminal domain-containing protein [Alphaproteobacteria bacterium]